MTAETGWPMSSWKLSSHGGRREPGDPLPTIAARGNGAPRPGPEKESSWGSLDMGAGAGRKTGVSGWLALACFSSWSSASRSMTCSSMSSRAARAHGWHEKRCGGGGGARAAPKSASAETTPRCSQIESGWETHTPADRPASAPSRVSMLALQQKGRRYRGGAAMAVGGGALEQPRAWGGPIRHPQRQRVHQPSGAAACTGARPWELVKLCPAEGWSACTARRSTCWTSALTTPTARVSEAPARCGDDSVRRAHAASPRATTLSETSMNRFSSPTPPPASADVAPPPPRLSPAASAPLACPGSLQCAPRAGCVAAALPRSTTLRRARTMVASPIWDSSVSWAAVGLGSSLDKPGLPHPLRRRTLSYSATSAACRFSVR
eukprot:scaffold6446_cov104-Isochrysis_galbana.AAC.17